MGRPKNNRRGRRQKGFSEPGHRQAWDYMLRGSGVQGREKRRFFNTISGGMVLSAGLVGAFFGYSLLGLLGILIGFLVAGGLMANFVIKSRSFR